ncbi:MAG: hypothetical protein BWY56_02327 [Acidobacteria bacterium ADurb.Bin340]|nr:MAG: hypothetical protein BWY56_02327 [Acidobacteria bacterium ADurb.Bin340]
MWPPPSAPRAPGWPTRLGSRCGSGTTNSTCSRPPGSPTMPCTRRPASVRRGFPTSAGAPWPPFRSSAPAGPRTAPRCSASRGPAPCSSPLILRSSSEPRTASHPFPPKAWPSARSPPPCTPAPPCWRRSTPRPPSTPKPSWPTRPKASPGRPPTGPGCPPRAEPWIWKASSPSPTAAEPISPPPPCSWWPGSRTRCTTRHPATRMFPHPMERSGWR